MTKEIKPCQNDKCIMYQHHLILEGKHSNCWKYANRVIDNVKDCELYQPEKLSAWEMFASLAKKRNFDHRCFDLPTPINTPNEQEAIKIIQEIQGELDEANSAHSRNFVNSSLNGLGNSWLFA